MFSDAPESTAGGFRFGGGYRFNRHIGLEMGIADSNGSSGCEFCNFVGSIAGGYQSRSFSSSTQYLAVVGALPLNDRAEVFGKFGQATTSLSYSSTTTPCLLGLCGQPQTVSSSASQSSAMSALGLRWRSRLSPLLYYHAQYENLGTVKMTIPSLNQPSKISNIGISAISLGVSLNF